MTGRQTPPAGPLDPGLQIERTRLAWGRTALAFAAAGALLMHVGPSGALGLGPGLAVVAGGVAIYVVGRVRGRNLATVVRSGDSVVAPPALRTVAACAAAAALLGAVSAIW